MICFFESPSQNDTFSKYTIFLITNGPQKYHNGNSVRNVFVEYTHAESHQLLLLFVSTVI